MANAMRTFEIYVGAPVGQLTLEGREDRGPGNSPRWYCRCACGKRVAFRETVLRNGKMRSCGCSEAGRKPEDLTGQEFGPRWGANGERLRVESFAGWDERGNRAWNCLCYCGNKFPASGYGLKTGQIVSCKCARKERLRRRNLRRAEARHLAALRLGEAPVLGEMPRRLLPPSPPPRLRRPVELSEEAREALESWRRFQRSKGQVPNWKLGLGKVKNSPGKYGEVPRWVTPWLVANYHGNDPVPVTDPNLETTGV